MTQLSVVVPTHNRRDRVLALLASLARQTAPAESFEVVLVVDGSDDGTEHAVLETTWPFRLVVEQGEQSGVECARNRGVDRASGVACLFLDDDIVADENLVAEHLGVQRGGSNVVSIGRLAKLRPSRAPRWARYSALEREEHYRQLKGGRPPAFLDCYGGNLCVPRSLFHAAGGFTTDINVPGMRFGFRYNDIELGYRLQISGARFVYLDGAFAFEDDRETLRDHVGDAEKRGASGVELYRRHPDLLPHLTLGRWLELEGKWRSLRSLLFAFHVPPLLVGAAGALVPTRRWAREWYRLLFNYCYWRGACRSLGGAAGAARVIRALQGGERPALPPAPGLPPANLSPASGSAAELDARSNPAAP